MDPERSTEVVKRADPKAEAEPETADAEGRACDNQAVPADIDSRVVDAGVGLVKAVLEVAESFNH